LSLLAKAISVSIVGSTAVHTLPNSNDNSMLVANSIVNKL